MVVTGPGTLTVTAGTSLDGDRQLLLATLGAVQVHLSFGVAGIDRRIKLNAQLDDAPADRNGRSVEWHFKVPAQDPWAEVAESP